MKRQELAHILRASCTVAGDADVLVIGSQAILGAYDDTGLPEVGGTPFGCYEDEFTHCP